MTVVLVAEADFENIQPLIGSYHWENSNRRYPFGYWIPGTLFQVTHAGSMVKPIVEASDLPVFYGSSHVDQLVYGESLTCLCKSRGDGSEVKALSALPPYWHEPSYFEFKRCFGYQKPGDSERYWRIISRDSDVNWLMGCWGQQVELSTWFKANSLT